MAQQNSLVGHMLGQYQIVELIGEGGMAAVYKAWQPSLRRYVALKVLAPHLSDDAQFVKRFHQEAVSAANLKHTHIVTIHDVGTESGYHYIAMEFIEGSSLNERIRSGQAFALEQVVDVISQVGSALDYAHQRGFIHRDIKPANILIDASGRAVLTDFGIVKALGGTGVTAPLTQAGTVFGTPQYMSPEQVKDEPLDYHSDLYSLGIVCYEMLSGQVPFDGTTTHSILYAQVNNPPPPLREFSGLDVPPPVEAVVEKMLAKERGARYDSAGEFARDLAQAVAGAWPAGMGGETAVVGGMGAGTAVIGGTPPGMPAPTVRQPMGPPTPPATVWQPAGPPTPAPMPAPARRSRWPLVLGAVAVGAGVLLILAVVGVLVLGIENPLKGIQVARDLKDAQAALDAGDYGGAAEGFNQVLESDPESVEAADGLLEAAANLAQAGQFDTAISAYETVLQVEPGEVRALQGLGQAYAAKGEWDEAARWYEKWAQAAPEDGSAFLALGSARFNLEEYERTVAAYERAGALDASSAEMDAHLGLAYFELAQYEEAVGYLQDAVGQNAEDSRLQRALGLAYFGLAQYEEAVGYLQDAVDQNAEDSHLQRALGLAYFELARYEEAVGHLRRAVAQNSEDFRLQRALGLSLYSLDQPEQAVEHLEKTCALGTDRSGDELVDVYYALGGYYFGERDYWQAIDFYEQAHELDPQGKTLWADESRANLDEAYLGLASNVMEEALLDLDFSNIVIEGDKIYAIAQTGHKAKIAGPVRVVDGPWAESQALVMEEGTTNECNDPSFEVETTSWVPASLGSIARNQDDAWKGTASLRCSSGGGQRYVQARYSGGFRSFDATVAYALSASYKLESLSAGGDVVFGAYWMGGANPDAYVQQAVGISEGGGWHRVSAVMTPDYDDRTEASFYFIITGATADEQSFLLDAFQVERDQAYATSYADGSLGDHYGWLSTPHASASTRLDTWATVPTAGIIDTSEGTIMMWLRFIGQETTHIRGLWSNHTTSDNMLQLFACWPSATDTTLFRSVGAERGVLASTELVVDRGWHQLVWTWNLESRLYIDGSLAATYSGDAWDGVALASDLYLGREVYSPPAFLNGAFARFVTFERTLSAREVRSLYRAGVPASR